MARTFLTSVLAIAVFAATVRAEQVYVGWQGAGTGILGAYDLATGSQIGPPPTFSPSSAKPQGVAVSPLNGYIYMATENLSSPIESYDPVTGNMVSADFANLSDEGVYAFGVCFDSSGYLYASMSGGSNPHVRYIAKISPDGNTVNYRWGTPVSDSAYYPSDLMIVGDTLYGGVPYGNTSYLPGGVVAYDLSGTDEGVGEWLTKYPDGRRGVNGVAFGPDGTMYTAMYKYGEVRAWSGPDYLWENSSLITDFADGSIQDIDYYDGYLYLKKGDVYRYDLSAQDPEWELFASAPTGYTGSTGFLDIVVPEPGTLVLLATGLVGLLCYAWRKRK